MSRLKQIEWANGEAVAVGLECLIEHGREQMRLYAAVHVT
jgi:hypothetical protein